MSIIGYAQCTPSSTNPDSDGDGIADICDYDDDNDGILDTAECPSINYKPIYHLYDYTSSDATDPLWLYKQENGIGSTFVCPSGTNCPLAPNGQPYTPAVNVTGTVQNLAYDDGKFFTINSNGDLLFTDDIKTGTFTNLGNAKMGASFKNLGYDNGIFYHWFNNAGTLTLYSSSNPTSLGWVNMGVLTGLVLNFTDAGRDYTLVDMAVNDGVFYFMYYSYTGTATLDTSNRTRVYSSSNPVSATSSWTNLGSTYFGTNVFNIAYGSEDILTVCDSDGDGIPNYLDLDSDNDGCPDAIEGGASFTASNLVTSSMPGGNTNATSGNYNNPVTQNLGNTVNTTSSSTSYGVPTIAGAGQSVNQSQTSNPVLSAGTISSSQTIITGNSASILSLTGATGNIQWQVSSDNYTFTNISGATNTTYNPGALTSTKYYRAIVTSAGGCSTITNTVTITVVPQYDCTGKIYSLSSVTGEIRIFNDPLNSGNLGTVINTATPPFALSGDSTNGPNALGFSTATQKFYYVLHQKGGIGNIFVSYDPATNSYETLASTNGYIYRGTVTNDGLGYYAMTSGNILKYYDILKNTWTDIAMNYVDQNGISINPILNTYSGGDIAMDGNGDLWILADTSNITAYVFRVRSAVPKTNIGTTPLILEQIVKQNIGVSPNGISFNSSGDLFISNASTLFKMNSDFSISAIGNISPSNGGGDLASCATPIDPFVISDFGDAPETYKTSFAANGPRHTASQYDATTHTAALMIGSKIDLEFDTTPNANADWDDTHNISDENSIILPYLNITATTYTVNVPVNNTTGVAATLRGWIDFNKNGVFDATEATSVTVPNGATSVNLTWTGIAGLTSGDTYYRLRIAKNNADITLPYGIVFGGEVEDGKITIEDVCFRDPVNNGTGADTKMGITLLKRAGNDNSDNWPKVRKSGHIALESNKQGFVITRISKANLGNISKPQEGMMVYDTTDKCLKIYSDGNWKCFSTPACP